MHWYKALNGYRPAADDTPCSGCSHIVCNISARIYHLQNLWQKSNDSQLLAATKELCINLSNCNLYQLSCWCLIQLLFSEWSVQCQMSPRETKYHRLDKFMLLYYNTTLFDALYHSLQKTMFEFFLDMILYHSAFLRSWRELNLLSSCSVISWLSMSVCCTCPVVSPNERKIKYLAYILS